MYIYFDRNGTIKEIINDESIRKGSSDYNKIYCYLEGNPDIDDIWYLQKNPDGTLTNEVSFVDNIVSKTIPYDSKRDMKYFQDFEEYKFYVFTLSSSYLSQNGLVVATIRVAENNTLWALGELTFNVQANIVNSDNDITQSQYDYLLLTISSYYSKTEIDNKFAKKDGSNVDTFKANDFILDGVSLKDNLFYYSDNTDITNTLTLTNHYLDKANGNANPDTNSKCTDYIDLSTYTGFSISGHSQYATTLICTYDENKTFLRSYGDGTSAGETFTDYEYIKKADEKYVRFSTYQYNQYPLKVVSLGKFLPINVKKQDNYLYNKKYVSCGDSFTAGDVISSDKVYPYLIAQRNNMKLVNMAHNGSYIHYGENGFTNQNNSYYYKNIPLDADIITIAYGLNETSTSIGTKESNDNTTIWGAYNEVLGWITTNIPNAKVGIISNDAWMTYELRNALQEIASYWGVEFLDLKEYGKPFMISGKYSQDGDTNGSVVTQRTNQYCVSSTNGHPNELGHKVRSYIIENFLRGAYGVNNSYTKTEVDSALSLKADKSNTYTKQEVNILGGDLQDQINSANSNISNLSTSVFNLGLDLDNLKSVQNVVEVVATYSALQSYDTSKLDVEDKVQVMADESHDGASTIYNWDGSAWQYIGAYGTNSYTKNEVDTKLSTKADKDKVYSIGQVENLLYGKADKSDTYTKSDVYTKTEVNDKLNGYIKNDDTTYSATVRGKEVIVSNGEGNGSITYGYNIHKSSPRKPSCDYSFPDEKSGTLALTSDIPTVNNPTITFIQGTAIKGTIQLNQSENSTIKFEEGGGSSVIANPTLSGNEATLNGLEVDGTKYKVGGGTATLDNIVDKNGNNRFINNYGIWSAVPGMQGIKATWSLNGYNLMFEALGSFSTDISINNNFTIVSFKLPKWILNKISVPFGNVVDMITFKIVGTTGDYTDIPLIINKTTNDKIAFMVVDSITPTESKIFRIRYNIIIDNL